MDAMDVINSYANKSNINLETFGYVLLFLYSTLGGFIGIIIASVLSATGKLDIYMTILIAIVGNIVGSSIYAYLARTQKDEIMKIKFIKKHRRKIAYLQLNLKKYDWYIILICKYLQGIRSFVPLAVGLSKYKLTRFLMINALSCVIWGILIGTIAYNASGIFLIAIQFLLQNQYLFPLIFIAIVIVAIIIYKISSFKKAKNNKKTK